MLTFNNIISICSTLGISSVLLTLINIFSINKIKTKNKFLKAKKEELFNLYLPLQKIFFQCEYDRQNCFTYLKKNRNKIRTILLNNFICVPVSLKKLFFELDTLLENDTPNSTFYEKYEKINNKITAKYEELKKIFYYPSIAAYEIAELKYPIIKTFPKYIRLLVCIMFECYKIVLQVFIVILVFISICTTIIALTSDEITLREQLFIIIYFLLIIYSAYIFYKNLK